MSKKAKTIVAVIKQGLERFCQPLQNKMMRMHAVHKQAKLHTVVMMQAQKS